jgi:hypothetical protein
MSKQVISRAAPCIINNTGEDIITNPQIVSDRFNIFFTEIIEDLLFQYNYHCLMHNLKFQIKKCSETIFVAPVGIIEVDRQLRVQRAILPLALMKFRCL